MFSYQHYVFKISLEDRSILMGFSFFLKKTGRPGAVKWKLAEAASPFHNRMWVIKGAKVQRQRALGCSFNDGSACWVEWIRVFSHSFSYRESVDSLSHYSRNLTVAQSTETIHFYFWQNIVTMQPQSKILLLRITKGYAGIQKPV